MRAVLLIAVALAVAARAYYLPGIEPVEYEEGEPVEVQVNGLHSLTGVLPYTYYSAPFCKPDVLERRHEALGEILMGDRIETSPYVFNMGKDEKCRVLQCGDPRDRNMNAEKLRTLHKFIENNYRGYLVLDNLPVFNNGSLIYGGKCKKMTKQEMYEYQRGYALGVPTRCHGTKTLVNNHLHFRIQFSRPVSDPTKHRVVGFTATPFSIKHDWNEDGTKIVGCDEKFDMLGRSGQGGGTPVTTDPGETQRIGWTYSVEWSHEPSITWATRWDSYLHTSFADTNDRVHWFSIVNSLLVVFCLMTVTLLVLVRSLRKDFAKYADVLAQLESPETAAEESGWKNIHKEVNVPPTNMKTLIVFVSTGAQVMGMISVTLIFAAAGFLSPANRGGLLTAVVLLFVVQAFVAGYLCARMLRRFCGLNKVWGPVVQVGLYLPSACFVVVLIVNALTLKAKTSTSLPILTVLGLLALWLLISIPLLILGAAFGFSALDGKDDTDKQLLLTEGQPTRKIPEMPPMLSDVVVVILPALIPFGALFLELRFILASLWQGMVYYVFGFLAIVFTLWALCAALTTVVVIYYRLCAENYNWWWVSFFIPSGCGVPLAVYSAYYFLRLGITTVPATVVYFCYMGLATLAYIFGAGAIGFFSAHVFIRKIYAAIKLD